MHTSKNKYRLAKISLFLDIDLCKIYLQAF